jgi:hypothetical protein
MLCRRHGTWEPSWSTLLPEVSDDARESDKRLTSNPHSHLDQDNGSADASMASSPCRGDCGCFSRADWLYHRDQQHYAGPERFNRVVRPIRAQW